MRHTEVISVDPREPEPDRIEQAAAVLRRGGLVAFPTETVYGLGADALREEAVQGIFTAKGRPAANPLIVHVPDAAAARALAADWPEAARRLAERFWPGGLTLVVPRADIIPPVVTAGGPTVALRVPAHPVALALLAAVGVPLAAPSANRSNQLSPTRAAHVLHDLDGRVDLILDGGPAWGGLESTVLDVTTDPPRLLRPGLVTRAQLEAVIGPVTYADRPLPAAEPVRSPGLLGRHYAPRAVLECVAGSGRDRVAALAALGLRVGWLALGGAAAIESANIVCHTMPTDATAYAAALYAALHDLDAAGVDRIVVDLPPDADNWLAIRDRLRRAASPPSADGHS